MIVDQKLRGKKAEGKSFAVFWKVAVTLFVFFGYQRTIGYYQTISF
jgi:hypothetical protein